MNAAPTASGVRPRRALYLRALWPLHRFLLRLFTTRSGGQHKQQVGGGIIAAEPGDKVDLRLVDLEHPGKAAILRVEPKGSLLLEYQVWLLRRPD